MKNNHLSNPLQSAYRKHHSTESASLRVHDDVSISMDKVTALFLKFSAAHLSVSLDIETTDKIPVFLIFDMVVQNKKSEISSHI